MNIDNTLFAAAVDRVATISDEKSRSVQLAVEAGKIILTVRNMETGQATEEVEVDYDGEPFEIGFNARYLMDVTGQIGGENADPGSPSTSAPSNVKGRHPGARPHRRGRAVCADALEGLIR